MGFWISPLTSNFISMFCSCWTFLMLLYLLFICLFVFCCDTPNALKCVALNRKRFLPYPSINIAFPFWRWYSMRSSLVDFQLSTKVKANTVLAFVSSLTISLFFPRAREWIKEIMNLSLYNEHNSLRYCFCSLLNWDCAEIDRHVRRWLRLELLTSNLYIACSLTKSPLKACCK